MKREPRLSRLHGIGELTHAALTVPQLSEQCQSSFVRQGMKECHSFCQWELSCHTPNNTSKNIDLSNCKGDERNKILSHQVVMLKSSYNQGRLAM